jgi:chaperonin cofactor prefoldin
MAKETKEERLARLVAEREWVEAEEAATYPQRLMALLSRAQAVNHELQANPDLTFTLYDRDDLSNNYKYTLNLFYSTNSEELLNDLTWRVELKEQEAREAERKYQVKQAALNKLSEEERELLGL